ncbi:MAG: aminotransferase class I/II-fold pyridoxal phosphate-dependent enzyme [Undibacterium sp.]|nr:aminotransferase class I/II-fold pyridoxal phosphate-dependent enzyme [Undibacterium sp.]
MPTQPPSSVLRIHGGTDTLGKPSYDFSTNSNALGPCPEVLTQICLSDCSSYPDPDYHSLRTTLAVWHGVSPQRILFAASASEFIFRISSLIGKNTAATQMTQAKKTVWVPPHSYGDYALAARMADLEILEESDSADLIWACEPSSPLGQNQIGLASTLASLSGSQQLVLDCAYQALRLSGHASLSAQQRDVCWQLFTPNKALGLTGIRGAYVIAPLHAEHWQQQLEQMAASWPLGSHAVTMLNAWVTASVQDWLANSLLILREWKQRQIELCMNLGWQVKPSDTNFFCVTPTLTIQDHCVDFLRAMRAQGIKLRDAGSFGLDDCFRLRVLSPPMQDAFYHAVKQYSPHYQS